MSYQHQQQENKPTPRPLDTPTRTAFFEYVAAQERELSANMYKGGWQNCTVEEMWRELEFHIEKFRQAIINRDRNLIDELGADCGNVAMMVRELGMRDARPARR